MKSFQILFVLGGLLLSSLSYGQTDTISYSIGMSVGARMANQGANDIDYQDFLQGVRDMIEKTKRSLLRRQVTASIMHITKNRRIKFLQK